MTKMNRRQFLDNTKTGSLGVAAGLTILGNAASARGAPAADSVRLGMIGVGGRGNHLAEGFLAREAKDCQVTYVSDVDANKGGRCWTTRTWTRS
jgi:hypothetical protein